jgi:hypothetical protein
MLSEASKRCPECGADILADDAVTVGRRRPVFGGMVVGAVGVVIGILALGYAGKTWWDGFDGSRWKTVAMLRWEMVQPEPRVRTRACAELERRIGEHGVSAAQMQDIAQEVLKRQAGANWEPRWGDLLQVAHETRLVEGRTLLAEDLWGQFLRQGMQITARVRPKVREGDAVPIGVTCRLRVGTRWLPSGVTFVPTVEASSGGVSGRMTGSAQGYTIPVPLEWVVFWHPGPELGAGAHDVKVAVTVATGGGTSGVMQSATVSDSLEIVERASKSVAFHAPNARERQDFEAALRWQLRETNEGVLSLSGGTLGKLWVGGPPATAAFRVVLRQGEGVERREWLIGRFMVRPGDALTVPLGIPAGVSAGAARIVCVPDDGLAAMTTDVLEVWGEEVVREVRLGS